MTDEEIRTKLQVSPEEGCKVLFDEYWNYVYAIVWQFLRGRAGSSEVEECVADVLSDVALRYDAERETSLKSYVWATARSRAIDSIRGYSKSEKRSFSLDCEDSPEIASAEDVAAGAERSETARLLLEQIEALGDPDATIIMQKYYFDRNSVQIGRIIGMNPITVRNRLSRALKKLRPALEKLDITL